MHTVELNGQTVTISDRSDVELVRDLLTGQEGTVLVLLDGKSFAIDIEPGLDIAVNRFMRLVFP